jgi:hypothetical protein
MGDVKPVNAAELRSLVDRQLIVDVLNRYAVAIDDKNWSLLDDVFVDGADCDFSPLDGERSPFPQIVAWLSDVLAPFTTQHILSNHVINLSADTASTSTYLQAQHRRENDEGVSHHTFGGVYRDQFVRTADGWRIASRVLAPMWMTGA